MTKLSALLFLLFVSMVLVAFGVRGLTGSKRTDDRELSALQDRERLWMESRQSWDRRQHSTQFRNTKISTAGTVATFLGLLLAILAILGLSLEPNDEKEAGKRIALPPAPGTSFGVLSPGIVEADALGKQERQTTTTAGLIDNAAVERPAPASTLIPPQISDSQAEDVLLTYFRTAGRRSYSEAWSMLSPAYQGKYGSRERFAAFWDKIATVGPSDLAPRLIEFGTSSLRFVVDVYFERKDGSKTDEVVAVKFQRRGDGTILIDDYESLG